MLGLLVLTSYWCVGALLAAYGAMNLRNSSRTGMTSLFTHQYNKDKQPILFWMGVILSLGGVTIGIPMVLSSSLAFSGIFGAFE